MPITERGLGQSFGTRERPRFSANASERVVPCDSKLDDERAEAVLEVAHVTPEDVYAWGGFAGNFDELRKAAEAEGLSPEEIVRLEPQRKLAAGQEWWLSEECSRALALRMAEVARQRYIHPPPVQT